jgi:hypothetical protein
MSPKDKRIPKKTRAKRIMRIHFEEIVLGKAGVVGITVLSLWLKLLA